MFICLAAGLASSRKSSGEERPSITIPLTLDSEGASPSKSHTLALSATHLPPVHSTSLALVRLFTPKGLASVYDVKP